MKKDFYIGEIKGELDSDYYDGIKITDSNGYEVYIARNNVEKLNRVCNLIPYREDVVCLLKQKGFSDRVNNNEYVDAITERYEELRHENDGYYGYWETYLNQAFMEVDYIDYSLKDKPQKSNGRKR